MIEATKQFAAVYFGNPHQDTVSGADQTPIVVVEPDSWIETDEVEPVQLVRVCVGSIYILHRDEDARARIVALEELGNVVGNALNGKSIAEATLPRMTTVAGGRYHKPDHPNQVLRLELRFAHLVEGDDGRDESEE